MHKKKSIAVMAILLLSAALSASVFTGCSGGSDKSSSSDSSSMQTAPAAAPADTSQGMGQDTTKLDSASTRPIKSPTQ